MLIDSEVRAVMVHIRDVWLVDGGPSTIYWNDNGMSVVNPQGLVSRFNQSTRNYDATNPDDPHARICLAVVDKKIEERKKAKSTS